MFGFDIVLCIFQTQFVLFIFQKSRFVTWLFPISKQNINSNFTCATNTLKT